MQLIGIKDVFDLLREKSVVVVTFIKLNGQERRMYATLNFDAIPPEKYPKSKPNKKKEDPSKQKNPFIRVFDTEKGEWRGFNYLSVINMRTLDGNEYSIKK